MKILITGGTGFIGTKLCESLHSRGHQLTVLSRHPERVPALCGEKTNAIKSIDDLTENDAFAAIINLAGESVADGRWTAGRKKVLLESRVHITQQLIDFMQKAETKPDIFISGSAVGYYGNQPDQELSEDSTAVDCFSHRFCAEWEKTAQQVNSLGIRLCIIRIGLVVGPHGGFLHRMLLPFKYGFGGRLGSGKQWLSWIHRDDLIRIIGLLLINPKFEGIYNATAPNPVTNNEFTKCLAKVLNRPAILPVATTLLQFLLGEMSDLLLGGQKVMPTRLLAQNFVFKFETLKSALTEVLTEDD